MRRAHAVFRIQATTPELRNSSICPAPEKYLRPREAVFKVDYQPPADQLALGSRLVKDYQVKSLTSCSTCHR